MNPVPADNPCSLECRDQWRGVADRLSTQGVREEHFMLCMAACRAACANVLPRRLTGASPEQLLRLHLATTLVAGYLIDAAEALGDEPPPRDLLDAQYAEIDRLAGIAPGGSRELPPMAFFLVHAAGCEVDERLRELRYIPDSAYRWRLMRGAVTCAREGMEFLVRTVRTQPRETIADWIAAVDADGRADR